MTRARRLRLTALALAAALPAALARAGTAPAAPARSSEGAPSAAERALLHSHELWSTIDVCSPPDQHDVVGVRGSMPGDGDARDAMYMSFRLQYLAGGGRWTNLGAAASSGWVSVGDAALARQEGTSFDLKPAQGRPPVTLRGVVDFQWRRGGRVVYAAAEPTSAEHRNAADADPAGYSAATCAIG